MKTGKTVKTVIYVLQLQNGKYYVGRTDNHEQRILQHTGGLGSEWTKKHRPISTEPVEMIEDEGFMELSTTLKYMKKYGVDNVRGADYSTLQLSKETKDQIEQHFRSEDNRCFKCGGEHFVRNCNNSGWSIWSFFSKCFTRCKRCKNKQNQRRVNFGKHTGKTYDEILTNHPEYCYWVLNNTSPPYSPGFEEFRTWCSTQTLL